MRHQTRIILLALALIAVLAAVFALKDDATVPPTGQATATAVARAEPTAPAPTAGKARGKTRLYWFIPDGMRAEPDLFDIYAWAEQGRLPNVKRMMARGAWGFSKPVFPSHTPVNFATLLTGTMPRTHGVADGPMHIEGHALSGVSLGGFRSVARKIPAVWSTLEEAGRSVLLESVPGSTPPELNRGVVFRGRWGGWGADVHAVNFESAAKGEQRYKQGRAARLFYFGPALTAYLEATPAEGWKDRPESFSPLMEVPLASWGVTAYARLLDGSDDGKVNYDRVQFSTDRQQILAELRQGEWSQWHPVTLKVRDNDVPSNWIFHVIKLGDDGFFRLRVRYDNMNASLAQPSSAAGRLVDKAGPMVDFVDNFPPQLIHYAEDRTTFLAEMHRSFDWHLRSIPAIRELWDPEVVIHNIYSPNQMLTSRWWMGHVDPASTRYAATSEEDRAARWQEVRGMYKRLDDMIGKILETVDDDTLVVISSDHGACVLNKWVHINNVLARAGYLKFTLDPVSGVPTIDWANSKAVYLKMIGVFLHPDGLAGNYHRGSGPAYEKLRSDVAALLLALEDDDGVRPVTSVTPREQVDQRLGLPPDRVGDLVISNRAGYGWIEEFTSDLKTFSAPLKSGYKQAILVEETKAMWTPFMIAGPGVKPGTRLKDPIRHIDQLPTILRLMSIEPPEVIEGRVLEELLDTSPAASPPAAATPASP